MAQAESKQGLQVGPDGRWRCGWCCGDDEYQRYHDEEWGFPVDDDQRLFEKMCLEGFQAGLSWLTILNKRENFRRAFDGFEFRGLARCGQRRVQRLLRDAGIVRHRAKIESTLNNARRAVELVDEFGSLAAYFWCWEPAPSERPRVFDAATFATLTQTPQSQALSRDLKRRGWTFVGPTTAYAFMQAMGLVNDHLEGCFVRPDVQRARRRFRRPV